MTRILAAATSALAGVLALAACAGDNGGPRPSQVTWAALGDGTYHVSGGQGFDPAAASSLLAVTAQLDRAAGRLVLTLADGSHRTLGFSPRDRSAWQADCVTGAGGPPSSVMCEIADLSPAPLQLETLRFATPLVYAKCSPTRMILADRPDEVSAGAFLILDRP